MELYLNSYMFLWLGEGRACLTGGTVTTLHNVKSEIRFLARAREFLLPQMFCLPLGPTRDKAAGASSDHHHLSLMM
jgi:hypothetical protein